MVFITIVTGAYKPTYNWGGHIEPNKMKREDKVSNIGHMSYDTVSLSWLTTSENIQPRFCT